MPADNVPLRIDANATFKKDETEKGNTDRLYWLNGKIYEKLDRRSLDSIQHGRAKL
jgi:hypothetical protein